jgi:demethylmenaquinone methyltransferase/2-methoxy-6-polyprenyl-1,4-benzoquinol methylase
MNVQTAPATTVDLAVIKGRQQAAWSSGDYAVVGNTLQIVGETLCEAIDLRSGERVLDVAAGSGNATLAAARRFADVVSTDYVGSLLDRGRERAEADGFPVTFREADAEALPFPDKSFDAYTIAFGIRNVPRIEAALAEAFRVLRIGGHFLCLEFSTVDVPGLDSLYDLYSFNVIPALGRSVAGDAEAYRYLVESIRRFPKPNDFAAMIAAAGFRRVSAQPLTGGIVALHSGWRL